MTKYNIFSENIYEYWNINERTFIDIAKKILKFYLSIQEVYEKSCLNGFDYKVISFDFLYCIPKQINRRNLKIHSRIESDC